MGEVVTTEFLEQLKKDGKGDFDNDGFFILNEGGFYDSEGYLFNNKYPETEEDGTVYWTDDYGGYYDKDGIFVPGGGYGHAYYEQYGADQEYDEYEYDPNY